MTCKRTYNQFYQVDMLSNRPIISSSIEAHRRCHLTHVRPHTVLYLSAKIHAKRHPRRITGPGASTQRRAPTA